MKRQRVRSEIYRARRFKLKAARRWRRNAPPTYITCGQCELTAINGVVCHETGCPNSGARWDVDTSSWVKRWECRECGCMLDVGLECDCNQPTEDEQS